MHYSNFGFINLVWTNRKQKFLLIFQFFFISRKKLFRLSTLLNDEAKINFSFFDHIEFFVIDDKHIVINNESPFTLSNVSSALFFVAPLLPWCFTLQELYQIKEKINLLRIKNIDWFILLNVNIFYSVQSLMNHYCRPRLFLFTDMQLCFMLVCQSLFTSHQFNNDGCQNLLCPLKQVLNLLLKFCQLNFCRISNWTNLSYFGLSSSNYLIRFLS